VFLFDTNVISTNRRGNAEVRQRLDSIPIDQTFVSVISLGEVMKGVEKQRLKDDRYAELLRVWLGRMTVQYETRILPVSKEVALTWGIIAAGRTRDTADSLIAATAIAHDLTLVTRNIRDFDDLPVKLFNPWDD
jgi:toxin FitB